MVSDALSLTALGKIQLMALAATALLTPSHEPSDMGAGLGASASQVNGAYQSLLFEANRLNDVIHSPLSEQFSPKTGWLTTTRPSPFAPAEATDQPLENVRTATSMAAKTQATRCAAHVQAANEEVVEAEQDPEAEEALKEEYQKLKDELKDFKSKTVQAIIRSRKKAIGPPRKPNEKSAKVLIESTGTAEKAVKEEYEKAEQALKDFKSIAVKALTDLKKNAGKASAELEGQARKASAEPTAKRKKKARKALTERKSNARGKGRKTLTPPKRTAQTASTEPTGNPKQKAGTALTEPKGELGKVSTPSTTGGKPAQGLSRLRRKAKNALTGLKRKAGKVVRQLKKVLKRLHRNSTKASAESKGQVKGKGRKAKTEPTAKPKGAGTTSTVPTAKPTVNSMTATAEPSGIPNGTPEKVSSMHHKAHKATALKSVAKAAGAPKPAKTSPKPAKDLKSAKLVLKKELRKEKDKVAMMKYMCQKAQQEKELEQQIVQEKEKQQRWMQKKEQKELQKAEMKNFKSKLKQDEGQLGKMFRKGRKGCKVSLQTELAEVSRMSQDDRRLSAAGLQARNAVANPIREQTAPTASGRAQAEVSLQTELAEVSRMSQDDRRLSAAGLQARNAVANPIREQTAPTASGRAQAEDVWQRIAWMKKKTAMLRRRLRNDERQQHKVLAEPHGAVDLARSLQEGDRTGSSRLDADAKHAGRDLSWVDPT
eukprot:TRINITY_DN4269_c0_g3_i1.p1 TRINITY_DN4269_c0_g3~~TRINITY_DN4269_c0_g3_i1.p1  ORF type:complete len:712 (-),score=182.12 TRINITY_DN4269_c0_g3_i1:159-2294(-)